jgi:SpoVK/Ycf46/Vps4 family AAA+-type ATPase
MSNINPKTNQNKNFKKSNNDIDLKNLVPNDDNLNTNNKNHEKKRYYKKKYYNNLKKNNEMITENNYNNQVDQTQEYNYSNNYFNPYYNYYEQKVNQSTQTNMQSNNQKNTKINYNSSIPYYNYYPNVYPYSMITNYPHNYQNNQSYQNYHNLNNNQTHQLKNNNNQLYQYKNYKENISNINQVLKGYLDDINKINNSLNLNEISIKQPITKQIKEFKWLNLEIKNLDDLIQISKDYGIKYSKDYEYQIDLEQLSSMIEELESLNKLVGLSNVKTQIVDIILYYSLKLDNKNYDLLHTVIEGDPGTGKTELAEKLGKIYLKMGILKKDIFKKVKRSDLIAGYLGQTAIKTEKVLEECRGGVLFIDEAYSLGNSEGKDGRDSFSKECIDIINQWLTENKSEFVCIIAGYKDDLVKSFFSYNSGLERRFPIRFSIESYTNEELAKIFIKKIKEHEWDIDCINLISIIKLNRKYFKFNGGDMEVLFSKCKIAHSKNLFKEKFKLKKVLNEQDIINGLKIFLENPEIIKRGENFISSIYI